MIVSPLGTSDLLAEQIDGLQRYHRARRRRDRALTSGRRGPLGRAYEQMAASDRARLVDRREHAAFLEHVEVQLAEPSGLLLAQTPVRAVVAYREPWGGEPLICSLEQAGVRVVASVRDGARAAGIAAAEQPDVLLVQDQLPFLGGLDVIRRVREYSPRTVLCAQLRDIARTGTFLDAGASVVLDPHVSPTEAISAVLAALAAGSHLTPDSSLRARRPARTAAYAAPART